jgi:hypothetical protein
VLLLEIPFKTSLTRGEELLSPKVLLQAAEIKRVKIVAESNPARISTSMQRSL